MEKITILWSDTKIGGLQPPSPPFRRLCFRVGISLRIILLFLPIKLWCSAHKFHFLCSLLCSCERCVLRINYFCYKNLIVILEHFDLLLYISFTYKYLGKYFMLLVTYLRIKLKIMLA